MQESKRSETPDSHSGRADNLSRRVEAAVGLCPRLEGEPGELSYLGLSDAPLRVLKSLDNFNASVK